MFRWRTQKPRRELLKFRSAAVIIQSRARVKRDQALFSAKLAAAKEEARRDEELKDLQKQVQKDKAEKAVDETLLVEIETYVLYTVLFALSTSKSKLESLLDSHRLSVCF
jgi:hypothetical protein